MCVCVHGQLGSVDTAEFMAAARQGKHSVVEQYLAGGADRNVHDEVNKRWPQPIGISLLPYLHL